MIAKGKSVVINNSSKEIRIYSELCPFTCKYRKCITQDIITPDAYTEDEHIIFNPKKLHFEVFMHNIISKIENI
jgi:hypothetical protein